MVRQHPQECCQIRSAENTGPLRVLDKVGFRSGDIQRRAAVRARSVVAVHAATWVSTPTPETTSGSGRKGSIVKVTRRCQIAYDR